MALLPTVEVQYRALVGRLAAVDIIFVVAILLEVVNGLSKYLLPATLVSILSIGAS